MNRYKMTHRNGMYLKGLGNILKNLVEQLASVKGGRFLWYLMLTSSR